MAATRYSDEFVPYAHPSGALMLKSFAISPIVLVASFQSASLFRSTACSRLLMTSTVVKVGSELAARKRQP
jgi:hypothetical protein